MANSYLELSDTMVIKTKEEKEWLEQQTLSYEACIPEGLDDEAEEAAIKEFCEKWELEEPEDWPGFGCDVRDTEVWFYSDESANPDNIAKLVQEFLKKFRPNECWGFEFAYTCSKPRAGEFGGGAVFVTADAIEWVNTGHWLAEQMSAFKKKPEPKKGQQLGQ